MAAAGERRRSARMYVLLLLVLAGVVWLLLPADDDGAGFPEGDPKAERSVDPALLAADAPSGSAAQTLKGRAAAASAGQKRGDVRVRVLGRGDVPVPGAVVVLALDGFYGPEGAGVETDAHGVAILRDQPYDGSAHVVVFQSEAARGHGSGPMAVLYRAGSREVRTPLTGPELVYRCRMPIPLDVRVVDAATGRDLPGVGLRDKRLRWLGTAPGGTAPARVLRLQVSRGLQFWRFDVQPPSGWARAERDAIGFPISPYATELLTIHPLRPEVEVSVTAVELNGAPAEARIKSVYFQGSGRHLRIRWSAAADKYGCLRIRGVPLLPGEVLSVIVTRPNGTGGMLVQAALPDRSGLRVDLRVTLPEEQATKVVDSVEVVDHIEYEESFGDSEDPSDAVPPRTYENEVVVTIRRRNGDPAVGASVRIDSKSRWTDERGVVRLQSIAPGAQKVQAWQVGLLGVHGTVIVPLEGRVEQTLQEGAGGTVHLSVVDDRGRPLSFAHFDVMHAGTSWLDVDGTRQRIDRFTDHRGRRTLRRLEPGPAKLAVRWGARHVVQAVEVKEGREVRLEVVLPRPKPPTGEPTRAYEEEIEEVVSSDAGR